MNCREKTYWDSGAGGGRALTLWSVSRPAEVRFEKVLIDDDASETAAFADINGDGKLDIASGDCW